MDKLNYYITSDGKYGISTKGTKVFTEDNCVLGESDVSTVDGRKIPTNTRKLLQEILIRKKERISRYYKANKLRSKIEELQKQISELETEIDSLEKERNNFQKEIDVLVAEYSEEEKMKSIEKGITGNEVLDMSFFNGTLDRTKAKAIIKKSKKPLVYTYGFAYRNPSTYRVALSKEEALDKVDKEGYLDIHFKDNEIYLNAFSSNDMW